MCDVPYGVLISGGLDSSIIAALAARFAAKRVEDGRRERRPGGRGCTPSPSGSRARPTCRGARGCRRSSARCTTSSFSRVQEGLDALPDVIRHLETYDVTTIRAATPMYLMARRINAMGIKMVLSGEGADEIFGGYLYFHKAPNRAGIPRGAVRKLDLLHMYDCLRANKSMAAWGVEARVPFLDKRLPRRGDGISTRPRRWSRAGGIEKQILREAFAGAPAGRDPLAAEGAVLRRRRLLVDRRAEGPRRSAGDRSPVVAAREAASRSTRRRRRRPTSTARSSSRFSRCRRRRLRPLRPERRLLLAGRARVGPVVQGERGSEREGGQGRAQGPGITRRSPWRCPAPSETRTSASSETRTRAP